MRRPRIASALILSCFTSWLPAQANPNASMLERPNWVEVNPATQLCGVRANALKIRDRAALDSTHLQIQLEELEELQKDAHGSEGNRRVVLGLVAGYIAASAVMGAMGTTAGGATLSGTTATRVIIGTAGSLIGACQDLIALAASGATFIGTTTLVTALGTWLSDAGLDKLNARGTPAEQEAHKTRLQSIEAKKVALQAADSELAAFTPETVSTLLNGRNFRSVDQSATYMIRGLKKFEYYRQSLGELMAEVGEETEYLQSLIEDYCGEHTLICASGLGARWNASSHVELQASLVRDRILKNTALGVRAAQIAAATEVLLTEALGSGRLVSACGR
jgi:hypothetical protein